MRMLESLRPNKSESGQEFKLFESARESIRVQESLRPNEKDSSNSHRFL